jgi:hypothetical protein
LEASVINGSPARYERRIFAPDLSGIEARLRMLAPLARYREGLETYLLLPGRADVNLKIRDDALELKTLVRRAWSLEQWAPRFRLELPADSAKLGEHLAGLLDLGPRLDEQGNWDAERLLGAVAQIQPGVALASLFKKRFGFVLEDCLAEVAEVLINGARLMTAAVESERPEAVLALQGKLGMEGLENVGYVPAVERVLGRAPLPKDAFYNARRRVARTKQP